MSGIVIGIDASRNRSGGAIDHIIGILCEGDPLAYGVRKIHIWSYKHLLDKLPDVAWLVKHNPSELELSLFRQVWWQYFHLPGELRKHECDILFASDAGTVCLYRPMVVFSQDALSYEPGVMKHFGFTLARLRLVLLYFVQNRSMRSANGVIYLTKYAADLIQRSTGKLKRIAIIAHGIDKTFSQLNPQRPWPESSDQPIRCIYVSNAEMYKNQWVVVRAVKKLRDRGFNIELLLVGGGAGPAQRLLDDEITFSDPGGSFVKSVGFVRHEELPYLIASSNVFIFASSCETISITLMEGMSVGLPIACSDKGPMPEVLGDGGVYFDPKDADSIAAALEDIIVNPDLRVSIAKRAKELSKQYTWERCSAETWRFLSDCAVNKVT
ncbi:glycosyltransferase family 4 protein [Geotalea uraniireducens]|uniref:Glycosyl transferase, group 1 n=1 Tax=Geotalea uraniireducens (strain Rf4) TaxID=351605 RepID=A5GEM9_GEOUR|nr:glycosyltransferase family 1 protein [Geotalea uraniireducens]ABQ25884.1 glycosyl transferase, group 1 [Geotalea uraniireducens Rf4]